MSQSSEPRKKFNMRRGLSFLGGLLSLGCVAYFIYWAGRMGISLRVDQWPSGTPAALGASFAILLTAPFLYGFYWLFLLNVLHKRRPSVATLSIYFVAQFAKYVPGNIAHLIGRVGLSKRWGIPVAVSGYTIGLELSTLVVLAAACALAYMNFFPEELAKFLPHMIDQNVFWWALGASIAVIAMIPLCLKWLGSAKLLDSNLFQNLSRRNQVQVLLVGLALHAVNFLIISGSIYFLAWHLFGMDPGHYVRLALLTGLAFSLGVLTPGSPAGVGVREVALASVLTHYYGAAEAVQLTALLRIQTVGTDLVVWLLGMIGLRHGKA